MESSLNAPPGRAKIRFAFPLLELEPMHICHDWGRHSQTPSTCKLEEVGLSLIFSILNARSIPGT